MTKEMVVHILECDAPRVSRREVLARCGATVDDRVPTGPATCPECLRLDAEDAASLAGLLIEDRLEDARGDH